MNTNANDRGPTASDILAERVEMLREATVRAATAQIVAAGASASLELAAASIDFHAGLDDENGELLDELTDSLGHSLNHLAVTRRLANSLTQTLARQLAALEHEHHQRFGAVPSSNRAGS